MVWTGLWPGEAECIEFGWFGRLTRDGWRACELYAPGAIPDRNRLYREAVWDRAEKRWKQPESAKRLDFFNPVSYEQRPVVEGECWGCQTPHENCPRSEKAAHEFHRLAGLESRSCQIFLLSLHEELLSLEVDPGLAPQRLELCLGCALRYMHAFNLRMLKQKKARSKLSPSTEENGMN
jgi:hypothetical protein